MAQDIREMFGKEDPGNGEKLKMGHQKRFEVRLDKEFPQEKSGSSFLFLKIAAVLAVALGVGFFFLSSPANDPPTIEVVETPVPSAEEEKNPQKVIQLSDISPEFKKIENYYLAGMNMELAKLEVTNDNKALIDAFMLQLEELDKEYQRLNVELSENPNEQTVEAMVANLQLRLELLLKLKNKLNETKNSKNNNYENLQA